jgi:nucleoside phosphorylase
MTEPLVDFAIITAIEIERQAVCNAFGINEQDKIYKGARTYWQTKLEVGDRQFYELVVTQLPDVGGVDAALAVADILKDWNPHAVLMVGIAGAARDDVRLGDLVVGREVYYYERCKDTITGQLPEPKLYPATAVLWDRINTIDPWNEPISVPRPDGTERRPALHLEVIAAGERVVANADIRAELASRNRKVAAIAMEGYGVSAAAWKRDPPVPCLEIRAISDAADVQKNDVWHPYAAAVAAEFTKHFLRDRPLTPRNPPHPPPDSGRYRLIIDDLQNGTLVPFLGESINALYYINLALKLARSVQTGKPYENNGSFIQDYELTEEALKNEELLKNILQSEELLGKLIGLPCSVCHYLPHRRPPGCPMIKNIQPETECPLYTEQSLAVSKINIRYLAQHYILQNNMDVLYGKLYEIFERLERTHEPSALHTFLAKLPHQMLAKGFPKRSPGLPFQLIVTTNYDDMLERAFIEAKQPYDVVFYVADGEERGKFKHKTYEGDCQIINDKNYDLLPLRSPWGRSENPRPVILKLFGTWEESLEDNLVATEFQMIYLMNILKESLPTSLISILKKGNILFVGYSPSDADLQQLMNCFWPENRISGKSWFLHQAKPGQLEEEIWHVRNVELLDMQSSVQDFVRQLERAIQERIQ